MSATLKQLSSKNLRAAIQSEFHHPDEAVLEGFLGLAVLLGVLYLLGAPFVTAAALSYLWFLVVLGYRATTEALWAAIGGQRGWHFRLLKHAPLCLGLGAAVALFSSIADKLLIKQGAFDDGLKRAALAAFGLSSFGLYGGPAVRIPYDPIAFSYLALPFAFALQGLILIWLLFLFSFLIGIRPRRVLLVLGFSALCLTGLFLALAPSHFRTSFFVSPLPLFPVVMGALTAVVLAQFPLGRSPSHQRVLRIAGGPLFFSLLVLSLFAPFQAGLEGALLMTAVAALACLLLACLISCPFSRIYGFLSLPVLRALGEAAPLIFVALAISLPFASSLDGLSAGVSLLLRLASVGAGVLAWALVARRLRILRSLFLLLSVAGLVVPLAFYTSLPSQGAPAAELAIPPEVSSSGILHPKPIAVLGDESASDLLQYISQLSAPFGQSVAATDIRPCSLIGLALLRTESGAVLDAASVPCIGQVLALKTILKARDFAGLIVALGRDQLLDQSFDSGATWRHLGQRGFDLKMQAALEGYFKIVASAGAPVVVVPSPYYLFDLKRSGALPPEDSEARVALFNHLLEQVTQRIPHTQLIKLDRFEWASPVAALHSGEGASLSAQAGAYAAQAALQTLLTMERQEGPGGP